MLHYGEVDRKGLRFFERLAIEPDEVLIPDRLFRRFRGRTRHGWGEALQFADERVGPRHKDAAVPQVARLDVFARPDCVGFLDEPLGAKCLPPGRDGLARHDVAVSGGRFGRHHPEGDDKSVLREPLGLHERGFEVVEAAHCVVGGHGAEDRVRVLGAGPIGASRKGGRRVAPQRLQNDLGVDSAFRKEAGNNKALIGAADHNGRLRNVDSPKALDRLGKQSPLASERQELFGGRHARDRP
jgi:hypothetical protein